MDKTNFRLAHGFPRTQKLVCSVRNRQYPDWNQKCERVISDYATTYYLCDVIIDTDYQHKGLGTALVSYIESLPEYTGLRGILITRDAHEER
jgi:ribosomal protein S18 acetylase RimI-like enzyme